MGIERRTNPQHIANLHRTCYDFFRSFNERLVKSPKLSFCGMGVACSLLGLHYIKGRSSRIWYWWNTMNLFDLKTVMLSSAVSNAICAVVLISLWLQNRKRSAGLGLWSLASIMELLAILLGVSYEVLPPFFSIVLPNVMIIGGLVLMYMGLERYTGKISSPYFNLALLAAFILINTYFSLFQLNHLVLEFNGALSLLVICFQAAWLMLRRVDPTWRKDTRTVGVIFALYSLVAAARTAGDFFLVNVGMAEVNPLDNMVIMAYQMLFVSLTFAVFLMVNNRLLGDMAKEISERKRAEDGIRAALSEKEVLLRELNHRTKNNLSLVNSMIQLQAGDSENEQFRALALTLENRIHSISLTHQMLYRSPNLAQIDLGEYAHSLVTHLLTGLVIAPEKIEVEIDAAPVYVGIETAIPCGQILNELLSNAFKYAFPGERSGRVRVHIRRTEDGQIALKVADNGAGLPAGFDVEQSDSLGLVLVRTLAQQLKGEMTLTSQEGVACEIRFKPG